MADIDNADFCDLVEQWSELKLRLEPLDELERLSALVTEGLGYSGLDYFLEDNPGAVEAILEFISEFGDKALGWRRQIATDIQAMVAEVDEEEEEYEEEEE